MKKSGKILAGVAVAAVVACGGIGMAGCGDTKAYVATAEQLFEAVEVVEEGLTIALRNDIVLDSSLIIEREVTIDLNGYTISRSEESANTQTILVMVGGDLTIEGNGTVSGAGANENYSIAVWAYGGQVTINGGFFTNVADDGRPGNEVVYVSNGGSVTINGGEFESETPDWTLNKLDADRETSAMIVKGGKFKGFDPMNNATEGDGTSFVADGYESELVGEYYVVSRVEA